MSLRLIRERREGEEMEEMDYTGEYDPEADPMLQTGQSTAAPLSVGYLTSTVRSGDTLSAIARDNYGDPMLYPLLHQFNRDRGFLGANPDVIQVGETILIPTIAELTSTAETIEATPYPPGIEPAFLDPQLIIQPQTQVLAPPPAPVEEPLLLGLTKTQLMYAGIGVAILGGTVLYFRTKKKKRR